MRTQDIWEKQITLLFLVYIIFSPSWSSQEKFSKKQTSQSICSGTANDYNGISLNSFFHTGLNLLSDCLILEGATVVVN